MNKTIIFLSAFLCFALFGCKFVVKDASASVGEIDCETYKN